MSHIYYLYFFVGVSICVILFLIYVVISTSGHMIEEFKGMSPLDKIMFVLNEMWPF